MGWTSWHIAYTRAIGSEFGVGLRQYVPGAPSCAARTAAVACFPTDHDGQIPLGTPSGEARRIVYTTEEETLTYRAQAIYQFENTSGLALNWAPLENFIFGGNGTGELSFADSTVDIWGRLQEKKTGSSSFALQATTVFIPGGQTPTQIFLVDALTKAVEQVTPNGTPGHKFNPYLFYHAGLDRNLVVFRHQVSASQTNLTIYQEGTLGQKNWAASATLTWNGIGETSDKKFLLSPEALTYGSATYLIFSTADSLSVPMQTTGSIWIARINNDASFTANKISVGGARIRVEGEVYYPNPGSVPVVFYSQYSNAADTQCPVLTCGGGGAFCLQNFNLRRIVLTAAELP